MPPISSLYLTNFCHRPCLSTRQLNLVPYTYKYVGVQYKVELHSALIMSDLVIEMYENTFFPATHICILYTSMHWVLTYILQVNKTAQFSTKLFIRVDTLRNSFKFYSVALSDPSL